MRIAVSLSLAASYLFFLSLWLKCLDIYQCNGNTEKSIQVSCMRNGSIPLACTDISDDFRPRSSLLASEWLLSLSPVRISWHKTYYKYICAIVHTVTHTQHTHTHTHNTHKICLVWPSNKPRCPNSRGEAHRECHALGHKVCDRQTKQSSTTWYPKRLWCWW